MIVFLDKNYSVKPAELLITTEKANGEAYALWKDERGVLSFGGIAFLEDKAYRIQYFGEEDMFFFQKLLEEYGRGGVLKPNDKYYEGMKFTCLNTKADFDSIAIPLIEDKNPTKIKSVDD